MHITDIVPVKASGRTGIRLITCVICWFENNCTIPSTVVVPVSVIMRALLAGPYRHYKETCVGACAHSRSRLGSSDAMPSI